MAFIVTKNHESVRNWIESRGGQPAIARDTSNENAPGLLEIKFSTSGPGLEAVSWEEFFDMFESRRMALRYPDAETEKELGLNYSFVDRDQTTVQEDDETELPEDNEMANENMFPSAPPTSAAGDL